MSEIAARLGGEARRIGAATWDASVASLARNGRLVTCGATTGFEAKIDLRHLFYKHLALLGSFMGRHDELWRLLPFFADGGLRPIVERVLPLERAAEAHRLMGDRAQFGKLVLTPCRRFTTEDTEPTE